MKTDKLAFNPKYESAYKVLCAQPVNVENSPPDVRCWVFGFDKQVDEAGIIDKVSAYREAIADHREAGFTGIFIFDLADAVPEFGFSPDIRWFLGWRPRELSEDYHILVKSQSNMINIVPQIVMKLYPRMNFFYVQTREEGISLAKKICEMQRDGSINLT